MTRVAIYERHPAVLEGLLRRLEGEDGLDVVGGFDDLHSFETGLANLTPDVAIVSAFGGGAIPAANLAAHASAGTKLLALVPGYFWVSWHAWRAAASVTAELKANHSPGLTATISYPEAARVGTGRR